MESFEERYARQMEEREKQLQQKKLEQQLKFKQMTKLVSAGILGLFLLVFLFKSCERIDAGHVGVKVNLYGDNKGVSDVTEVTGMVFYNPITHNIYEFPTYIQHKEYTGENAFIVNDGIEIGFQNSIPLWLFGFLY
jgi:hypothetical protein